MNVNVVLSAEQELFNLFWHKKSVFTSASLEKPTEAGLFLIYWEKSSLAPAELKTAQLNPEALLAHKVTPLVAKDEEAVDKPVEAKFLGRIKAGLSKTRQAFMGGVGQLFSSEKLNRQVLLEEVETKLLMADVGVEATDEIIKNLSVSLQKETLSKATLFTSLRTSLSSLLEPSAVENPFETLKFPHKPYVVLIVGVNGVGKTTTIGKLAYRLKGKGLSVLLAAGDTFRAAAVEQLEVWGERHNIPVISQHEGADSASVIFDAVSHAKAKNIDVVLADTAGRLHNKSHLMNELTKVRRVLGKLDPTFPHESLLILDACTGQNALSQTKEFHSSVTLSGIVLTKLDGTAKGGIIFALSKKFGLPIRYIGVGEKAEDLRPFKADEFIEALLETE